VSQLAAPDNLPVIEPEQEGPMTNSVESMMIAGVMSGTVHILGCIVRILEQNKLIPADEFAAVMNEAADKIEADHPNSPFPPNFPRTDVRMIRRLAATLERPQRGWKPIVIAGGLDQPEKT
jgi:hypothetical protein